MLLSDIICKFSKTNARKGFCAAEMPHTAVVNDLWKYQKCYLQSDAERLRLHSKNILNHTGIYIYI